MELSKRQEQIRHIVREKGPITGQAIADQLAVTRAALRSDLAVLTMTGILDARPKVGYFYSGKAKASLALSKVDFPKVGEIQSLPIAVTPATSLYDAIVTMFTEDVGTLLVCEDSFLAGIVSRKDLLRAAIGNSDPTTMPVSMIMTPVSKAILAAPEDDVRDAAQRMIDCEIDCLPVVVKENGNSKRKYKVVGRISKTTITQLFADLWKKHDVE